MDIKLKNISKSFGAKEVLKNISVTFESGKINAILGENGAGKTTLANIIQQYPGVAKIDQTPLLANELTILQNIYLCNNGRLTKRQIKAKISELCAKWCPDLNLKKRIYNCGADERFFASLLSKLVYDPQILILDEPASRLDWQEKRTLYANLRPLAEKGLNIIIITHSMSEAELYTDTITVLEHGRIAERYENSRDFERNRFSFLAKEENTNSANPLLSPVKTRNADYLMKFEHLKSSPLNEPKIIDASFALERGKVTLIQGSGDDGLLTLERALTGMSRNSIHGKITFRRGRHLVHKNLFWSGSSPKKIRNSLGKNSVALVSSDKLYLSSNPNLTVCQMLCIHQKKDDVDFACSIINRSRVNTGSQELTDTLSGGMLQKLILERELSLNPKLIILSEPLQGLDQASAQAFCQRLRSLSYGGKTILVLSSTDFPTVYTDKIYILQKGVLS